jgi:hypothetical protein
MRCLFYRRRTPSGPGHGRQQHQQQPEQDRAGELAQNLGQQIGDDKAILQITLIAPWFNYINRVADALGVGRE